jgi:hypothetical protein
MDIQAIYAVRNTPRPSVSEEVRDLISKLKISFKPAFRRPFHNHKRRANVEEQANWRETALIDAVRKVREKDDADYDEINANINKLSKTTYSKLMTDILERLKKRDEMFRLRVTTLLFDRGIHQNFFATLMADAYAEIAKAHPDALQDLMTQVTMFDKLYDTTNVTMIPASTDPTYEDVVVAWTKQKEKKRGFAVYVAELYSRGLVPEEIMQGFVKTVCDDLKESAKQPKNAPLEEHIDGLVRFLFAVAPKVPLATALKEILAIPKTEMPSLNMKSKFKLEDAVKLSR